MPDRSLLDLSFDELHDRLADLPRYRIDQIWHGIFRDLAGSYDEITTLPQAVRTRLSRTIPLPLVEPIREDESGDGRTEKILFRLADQETIESVTMEFPDRRTACVSSQVGCTVGCPFCATGQAGFVRDLTTGEIVAQVLHSARRLRARGAPLTHIVYMGMGEPFLNYDATLESIRILNDPRGFRLGARSFTVSTSGIVPGIDRFAEEDIQANLAVSLHAVDDATRDRLVPVNRRFPTAEVLAACRRYAERTHRRVTFEITLFDGVNDTPPHAQAAVERLSGLLCHVNLIPYNETPDGPFAASPVERIRAFAEILSHARVPVTIRHSMGSDIRAGCGQLRGEADRAKKTNESASATRSGDRDRRRGPARPSAR